MDNLRGLRIANERARELCVVKEKICKKELMKVSPLGLRIFND